MIFVVGPGRCGSSTVARLLHGLGVSMGTRFREPDDANPEGYWEDLDFKDINERVLQGKLTHEQWQRRMVDIERPEPWGLKDPRLCYLLPYYLAVYPTATVIRCVRPLHQVARSMHKTYGWGFGEAMVEAERRESLLDRFALDACYLHFGRRREDKEIECQLSNLLK